MLSTPGGGGCCEDAAAIGGHRADGLESSAWGPSIMAHRLLRLAWPLLLAAPLAHADVYTWTDASGRLNVSNVAPPAGVRVRSVVHEDPPRTTPSAVAARDAARVAEVQALTERVADLEHEIDRARAERPQPYRVIATAPPAPPVQIAVTVMPPPAPPAQYPAAPSPYADCDPLVFGCPPFVYPVGVVVLRNPGFGRFHRFGHLRAGHRMPARMPRPMTPVRHR